MKVNIRYYLVRIYWIFYQSQSLDCKSNLKILEAGMKGLPIFVQNIHPYTDDAKGIYKVDNWTAALVQAGTMAIEDIKDSGDALRRYVLERYDLNKVNELRRERL